MLDPTDPAPTSAEEPRKKSQQSKAITAYITAAEIFLDVASTDAEITPLLAARGYDAEDFAEGTGLAATARGTVEGRAGGMGNQSQKTAELNAAIEKARDEYAKFREIARPSFPDKADRLALSLTCEFPSIGRVFWVIFAELTLDEVARIHCLNPAGNVPRNDFSY